MTPRKACGSWQASAGLAGGTGAAGRSERRPGRTQAKKAHVKNIQLEAPPVLPAPAAFMTSGGLTLRDGAAGACAKERSPVASRVICQQL